MEKINYKDLKKNDRIKSNQIGVPITGKLMESPKQGKGLKKVILIWSNGSEVGMFDEHGSVYANQIMDDFLHPATFLLVPKLKSGRF